MGWAIAAGLLVLAPSTGATAQAGLGEAESHFRDGERFYEAGDLDSAIAAFQRAYALLEGNPERYQVQFNVGRCQEQLFRYDEALASYQAFTAGAPRNHERYAEAVSRMRALEQSLGALTVTSNASRAEVWIDDRRVGSAPGTVRVAAGRRIVELRAHGFAPSRQDVTIAARTTVPLTFTLDRAFAGLSPALFITGAALTVGALAVGLGFGGAACSARSEIDAQLASTDPRQRFQVTPERIASMEEQALVADVLLGTAGGLAIASIVLALVTDWGDGGGERARGPTLLPYASGTELGLVARGAL